MSNAIIIRDLTAAEFKPFGEVLEVRGDPDKIINQGMCGRHHDKACLTCGDGHIGISIFDAKPRSLPFKLDLMERHPLGSQAFIPMHQNPYLVVVAPDRDGAPDLPIAFLAREGQGVNYLPNTWHAVLCPLSSPGLFSVVDRIAEDNNLEEHWFKEPFTITSE